MIEQYWAKAMEFYSTHQTQVWVFLGGIVVLLLAYKLYQKYEYMKTLEVFEGKDLDERVGDDLYERVMALGEDVDMDLYYGDLNKVGHVRKKLSIQTPSDGTIAITSEQKQKIGEDMGDAEVFLLTPTDGVAKAMWIVMDKWLGMSKKSKFFIVNRDSYRTENGRIVMNDNCNVIVRGGAFVQTGDTTENVVNEIVTNDTYENILESLPNYVDKVNQFDSKHSQEIGKMEKFAEMNSQDIKDMIQKQ